MFRYPDKPLSSSLGALDRLVEGEWLADLKYDGWRALVGWDGKDVTLTSRHRKPLPATARLLAQLRDAFRATGPALLDGEWMGRRDGQGESLVLFDVLETDGQSCWGLRADERRALLLGLGLHVPLVVYVDCGYREFFERSKVPGCEGIVLKRKDSRLIGSVPLIGGQPSLVENQVAGRLQWPDPGGITERTKGVLGSSSDDRSDWVRVPVNWCADARQRSAATA